MRIPDDRWYPAPTTLTLSSAEVHVWRAPLDQPVSRIKGLAQTLTADEIGRARRFHFQKDQQRFTVARGLLRAILSRYLAVEPRQLRFVYNVYGKPALTPVPDQETLNFNVSHSGQWALYAVARGRQVGIDLEQVRPVAEAEQIARRFFSARENAVLRTLPLGLEQEALFTYWTRREAYVKARGDGLSMPWDQLGGRLAPDASAKRLIIEGGPGEARRWSLQELKPGCGYMAALVVEGHGWHLHRWHFPESTPQ